jgi:hypothetical protein
MDRRTPRTVPPNARGPRPPAAAGRRPQIELIAPSASPEEAAAIVAALERFMRATAPPAGTPSAAPEAWQRTAMLEAVTREDDRDLPHPWINT